MNGDAFMDLMVEGNRGLLQNQDEIKFFKISRATSLVHEATSRKSSLRVLQTRNSRGTAKIKFGGKGTGTSIVSMDMRLAPGLVMTGVDGDARRGST